MTEASQWHALHRHLRTFRAFLLPPTNMPSHMRMPPPLMHILSAYPLTLPAWDTHEEYELTCDCLAALHAHHAPHSFTMVSLVLQLGMLHLLVPVYLDLTCFPISSIICRYTPTSPMHAMQHAPPPDCPDGQSSAGKRPCRVSISSLMLCSPLPALTIPPHWLTVHQPTTTVSHVPPPLPPATSDTGITGDVADHHDNGDACPTYD